MDSESFLWGLWFGTVIAFVVMVIVRAGGDSDE